MPGWIKFTKRKPIGKLSKTTSINFCPFVMLHSPHKLIECILKELEQGNDGLDDAIGMQEMN